jgi:ATPase subunit of ABC transporter with duplicated ATPase domains
MRGERVAIIGPNGAGKTTLMKLILGELTPTAGAVKTGHEVHIGYFAQNHKEQIKPGITVYDWLLNHSNAETTTVVRSVLGSMLFSGDEAKKKSEALSGGEAARLVFSRLMLAKDNLLMLDEPTNHLDIESIEALAGSLLDYSGTVLFVSHDRFFVEIVATSILEITPGGFEYYKGSYLDFLAAREGQSDHLQRGNVKKERTKKSSKSSKEKPRDIRALNKELSRARAKSEKIENFIKVAEDRISEINSALAAGDLYLKGREEELEKILAELKSSEEKLASEMERWEKAHKRISEITQMVG